MELIIVLALLFVLINKFLQYSSKYHAGWIVKLSPVREIRELSEKHQKLVKERLELYEENQSISAQDNYARWTKNNRRLTKLDKDLELSKEGLKKASAKQDHLLKRAKLITLTLPFLALKLLKGKTIVYDLPTNDTFPVVLNGILTKGLLYIAMLPLNFLRGVNSQDFATAGVSLSIWLMAFNKVIDTIEFMVNQFSIAPVPEPKVGEPTSVPPTSVETTKPKEPEPIINLKTTEAELD